ncbi:hypothetical protein ACQ4W7_04440 [Janthinobacterium sp. MDT1-19]
MAASYKPASNLSRPDRETLRLLNKQKTKGMTMSNVSNSEPVLTKFWLKAGFSILALMFLPVFIGIPAVIIFWIWSMVRLGRQKTAFYNMASSNIKPEQSLDVLAFDGPGTVDGDANGPEWTYTCSRFSLHLDFENDTARLLCHDKNACIEVRSAKEGEDLFDRTFPASDLSCSIARGKTKLPRYLTYLNVSVFQHRAAMHSVKVEWDGDSLIRSGSCSMQRTYWETADYSMASNNVDPVLAEDFWLHWLNVEKRLELISKARADVALAAEQDRIALQMVNFRSAWTAERAVSMERVSELKKQAGLGEALSEIALYENGSLAWIIAADRSGSAVIELNGEVWMGSLKEACATASLDEIPAKANGAAPTFALGIVVKDEEFERSHLHKRRFQLMVGYSKEQITTWIDRIEILAR